MRILGLGKRKTEFLVNHNDDDSFNKYYALKATIFVADAYLTVISLLR